MNDKPCPKCGALINGYENKDTNPKNDKDIGDRIISINCPICGFMCEAEYNYRENDTWSDTKELLGWVTNYEEINEPNKDNIESYRKVAELYNMCKEIEGLSLYTDDIEEMVRDWNGIIDLGGEEHTMIPTVSGEYL